MRTRRGTRRLEGGAAACSRHTQRWRGKIKIRVRTGSVGIFIPQGSIRGLIWTMGWAGSSKMAEII